MRILELFSGTGSVGAVARKFWPDSEVISIDILQKCNPTICVNILGWAYKEAFEPGDFDIVWASPPCTEYSRAKTRGVRNLQLADAIAEKTLEIIQYFNPNAWFIENPGTGMLKDRDFMQPYEKYRNTCSYCMYGFPYRKLTSIWSNITLDLKKCCKKSPCMHVQSTGIHPAVAQQGSSARSSCRVKGNRLSTLHSIPEDLIKALFQAVTVDGLCKQICKI